MTSMTNNSPPPIFSKKAVSPVIATIILISVAITISVAVAFWMGGISSLYTRFEQLEIIATNSVSDQRDLWGTGIAENCWIIEINCRNKGVSTATITQVHVNGKPLESYGQLGTFDKILQSFGESLSLKPGEYKEFEIIILEDGGADYSFSTGTICEFRLHSGSGMSYPGMVTL